METQRILMRSLAVVFFASVIWTITAGAEQKVGMTCCEVVSRLTREEFPDPIIAFRLQKHDPPCVKAVIAETERGEFCLYWRQPWVKEEVKQFFRAQRNKRLTSTPPPASSISKHLTSTSPPASSISKHLTSTSPPASSISKRLTSTSPPASSISKRLTSMPPPASSQ